MNPRRRILLALLAVVTAVLTGCVTVPTSGPVEKVAGEPPECRNCVDIDVAPPAPGDDPKQIVQGFLRANANFQPNYARARQFLTTAAAERWSPEAGVLIYSGATQARGNTVILAGRLLGRLGRDRSYTAEDAALSIDFGLVKERGQWRINTPPRGLLVAEFAFSSFYQPYSLYFIGTGTTLVPDPIYLPNLRNPAGLASVLMSALLNGPSAWLKPAVTSAIPSGTTLSVDAVPISDGVAEVALSDTVLQLNDSQRTLLAAQVVYTLRPTGVQGVRFTVNGQPYPVPGVEPSTDVVSVATYTEFDPVPFGASDQLYAVRNRSVQRVAGTVDNAPATPVAGPLGAGRVPVDALAISVSDTDVAVVSNGRTTLRRAETANGQLTTLLNGVSNLLKPQFTRFGTIWAVGDHGGRQRIWVQDGDRRYEVQTALTAHRTRLTAFAVSPDGSRLAAVRSVNGRTELGIARITRAEGIRVDGWRTLRVNRSDTPNLSFIRALAWSDATNLVVLGGSSREVPLSPFRVSQDASRVTADGEPNRWDGVAVTVSLRSGAAVVLGRDGQAWRDSGAQWVPFLDKVQAIAYPG